MRSGFSGTSAPRSNPGGLSTPLGTRDGFLTISPTSAIRMSCPPAQTTQTTLPRSLLLRRSSGSRSRRGSQRLLHCHCRQPQRRLRQGSKRPARGRSSSSVASLSPPPSWSAIGCRRCCVRGRSRLMARLGAPPCEHGFSLSCATRRAATTKRAIVRTRFISRSENRREWVRAALWRSGIT